jgi:hypothetical protein
VTAPAPERHFPTDEEVDAWMDRRLLNANPDANPVTDQMKAAHKETTLRFLNAMPGIVTDRPGSTGFINIPTPDGSAWRGTVRQLIAAESFGLVSLCPHTQLIRPLMVFCDPPVVACYECFRHNLDRYTALLEELGHFWNHQCDRCGAHSETMTETTTGGLGFLTVVGHVCNDCAAEDQQIAWGDVEDVIVVQRPRRRPPSKSGIHKKRPNK